MAKTLIIRIERERPKVDKKGKPVPPKRDTDRLADDVAPIITPLIHERWGEEVEVIVQAHSMQGVVLRGWKKEGDGVDTAVLELLGEVYDGMEMEKYDLARR
jgi:hypothetical protein